MNETLAGYNFEELDDIELFKSTFPDWCGDEDTMFDQEVKVLNINVGEELYCT